MTVPGNVNELLLRTAAAAGAYSIDRSLRFNSADSAYLSRTPGSAGNKRTWTWSGWVKRSSAGTQFLFTGGADTSNRFVFILDSDRLQFYNLIGDVEGINLLTSSVYRDFSAWYHILLSVNTTAVTESDRVKFFVNGTQITAFSTSTYPSQNYDTQTNTTTTHWIGSRGFTDNFHFNGYLADVYFIDGTALTPSTFGEFDATTGVWVPKTPTGLTYGTNGFRLTFSDNSGTTATTLGKDAAGSNNWTPNNFSVTAGSGNDSLRDSPTNGTASTGGDAGGVTVGNYATWNPLDMYSGMTLANGNLEATGVGTTWRSVKSTLAIPGSGKWYFEMSPTHTDGVHGVGTAKEVNSNYCGATTEGWGFQSGGYYNSTYTAGASYSANDVLMVAIDRGAQKLWFGVNGTWVGSGNPGSGTNATFSNLPASDPLFPMASPNSSTKKVTLNAGQRAFSYAAPTGFKGLCTANLPAPTIVKPSSVMDVVLYIGTGSALTPTSTLGFNPDLVWIKNRQTNGTDHALYDAVRGVETRLESNTTDAEATSDSGVTAFNSAGFSIGTLALINTSPRAYVSWLWDAGTSNATNTSGTITSTVRANISAGFSVVTWTGTFATATIGHGLGATPEMIIVKNRDEAYNWGVYTKTTGNANTLFLDLDNASTSASLFWNSTSPTSSVFTVGAHQAVNNTGKKIVAYCWTPVAGYSAFGSYTGNGSSDGPFVYTGFRPRWVLIKNITTAGRGWVLLDSARNTYNVMNEALSPNTSDNEGGSDLSDFLSNGFKIRKSGGATGGNVLNTSNDVYTYAAFAESPFQYARAR